MARIFKREIAAAQGPFSTRYGEYGVFAIEKMSRNDCPYLVIKGTGCQVHAMPAKGFRKTGEVIVYWNHWAARTNYSLGVFKRECLVELILEFGNMQPRDMWKALNNMGMVREGMERGEPVGWGGYPDPDEEE